MLFDDSVERECYSAGSVQVLHCPRRIRRIVVPKLVTVWRDDEIRVQAKQYVRSYILFPSGVLGLVSMLGGVGGLAYQLVASSSYTSATFFASTALLLFGGLFGWVQTRYHRYLLDRIPHVFAARMRSAVHGRQRKKHRTDPREATIDHPGRSLVPFAYAAGVLALVGASTWAHTEGGVEMLPAVMMPWAGFYWGKLFFWRGIIE
jgi:hypothetical protein